MRRRSSAGEPSGIRASAGKPRGAFIQTWQSRSGACKYAVETSAPVSTSPHSAATARKSRNVACLHTPAYVSK